MAVITVYWKKFWGKQPQKFNEDCSMVFTLKEIMKATQNFSQEIGRGSFGSVFFGKLPDGKEIAVKVLREIEGFLSERPGLSELDWKNRLKIAIDAAEGLQYLHVCCTPMIIHRHVKTANILLDRNLNGKLCAFGLSMMTMDRKAPIDTLVAGSLGYLDPEYFSTQALTQKSDVYGFGMVLLEIISGRKPIDEINLRQWVKYYVGINENPGKMVEIIDKKMDGNYNMKSITIVAKLALRCVEETSSWRPSMSEVVGELKEAFMYEKVKLKAPVAKHRDSRSEVTIQVGR